MLYPDMLEINDTGVVFYKGYVFGYKTIIIDACNIASVSASAGLFFVDQSPRFQQIESSKHH